MSKIMKLNIIKLSVLCILGCVSVSAFSGCKNSKKAVKTLPSVQEEVTKDQAGKPEPPYEMVTLKNMEGLDGCMYMLITDSGKKLLPIGETETLEKMRDGQLLGVYYEVMDGAMSVCMAEDAIVRILQIFPIPPDLSKCADFIDPFAVPWLAKAIEKHEPFSIIKYSYLHGQAYYLQSGQRNFFYACDGTLVCEVIGRMLNDCARMIADLEEGEVIWVRNNKD
jgi:hypothetical protein